MSEQRYPEPTVGALIFNPEGKALLLKSHKWRGGYVVPGGHVELGETLEEALHREVKEETGLDVFDVDLLLFQEFIFDETFWERRHFIFFDYACRTDSSAVQLDSEAQDYVWTTLEDALSLPMDAFTRRAMETYLERQSR